MGGEFGGPNGCSSPRPSECDGVRSIELGVPGRTGNNDEEPDEADMAGRRAETSDEAKRTKKGQVLVVVVVVVGG